MGQHPRYYMSTKDRTAARSGHTRDSQKLRGGRQHRAGVSLLTFQVIHSSPVLDARCGYSCLICSIPQSPIPKHRDVSLFQLSELHLTASMLLDTFVVFGFDALSMAPNLALSEACLHTALYADMLYLSLQECRQLRVTTETSATFNHLALP